MAESFENKKKVTGNLADDLDSMLDESESSSEKTNELIDDEDAIDRLLMDNAFDQPEDEFEDEFAEIDDLISDSLDETKEQQGDDFYDEFVDETLGEDAVQETPEVDEIIDDEFPSQEVSDSSEIDADLEILSEFDEFEDEENLSDTEANDAKDEFAVDNELDISDDEFDDVENQSEELSATELVNDQESSVEAIKPNINDVDLSEIKGQLAGLRHNQDTLEQRLTAFATQDSLSSISEELQNLLDENKKYQRRIVQLEQQKPTVAYVALTVSVIAFLVGAGLGFLGFRADSKTSSLKDYILTVEEQLDAWVAKGNNSNELQPLKDRLERVDSEIAGFSVQLAALKTESKTEPKPELDENVVAQIKQLSDQVMQTAEVVEALQLKVDKLSSVKTINTKKPKVANVNWVVNLVSFKQEWYAKRKASEYQKQGVPVELQGVSVKGENWYRLRVGGFKTKYEAAAYAAKVKKSLNLTSVWVTKD